MRYPIENKDGSVSDKKYSITFTHTAYDPEQNLWCKQLEEDPEYRRMIFQQMQEDMELSGRHAEERIRYIARKRRERSDARVLPSKVDVPDIKPEPTTADLGRVIKALRKKRKWTLARLSHESGVSIPYLSNLEKGQREASLKTLRQIGDAFEIRPSELWKLAGQTMEGRQQ